MQRACRSLADRRQWTERCRSRPSEPNDVRLQHESDAAPPRGPDAARPAARLADAWTGLPERRARSAARPGRRHRAGLWRGRGRRPLPGEPRAAHRPRPAPADRRRRRRRPRLRRHAGRAPAGGARSSARARGPGAAEPGAARLRRQRQPRHGDLGTGRRAAQQRHRGHRRLARQAPGGGLLRARDRHRHPVLERRDDLLAPPLARAQRPAGRLGPRRLRRPGRAGRGARAAAPADRRRRLPLHQEEGARPGWGSSTRRASGSATARRANSACAP